MIVCVCNGINDREVKTAIRNGAASVEDLSARLGVGTCCGCCRETCADMLAEARCDGSSTAPIPVFPIYALTPLAA